MVYLRDANLLRGFDGVFHDLSSDIIDIPLQAVDGDGKWIGNFIFEMVLLHQIGEGDSRDWEEQTVYSPGSTIVGTKITNPETGEFAYVKDSIYVVFTAAASCCIKPAPIPLPIVSYYYGGGGIGEDHLTTYPWPIYFEAASGEANSAQHVNVKAEDASFVTTVICDIGNPARDINIPLVNLNPKISLYIYVPGVYNLPYTHEIHIKEQDPDTLLWVEKTDEYNVDLSTYPGTAFKIFPGTDVHIPNLKIGFSEL